jgi:hypothetical protein
MAQDMIAFQASAVPAHIRANPHGVQLNANAQQGVRLTFPVVSIEGRVWSVTHRGVETVIKSSEGTDHHGKPLPEAPVRALNVVIVGISPAISKAWYAKAFQPGVKVPLPDCFSTDGETPDAASPNRQSELCSTCPKNQFESAISDDGTKGKGKACRDGRKIAVVPAGDIANSIYGGPMMLRLPVMSIPNLAKYCGQLSIAGIDVTQVVTSMSFNMDVRYPEVIFTALGFIQNPIDYDDVCDWARSDIVKRMIDDASTTDGHLIDREPTREMFQPRAEPVDEHAVLIGNATDRLNHEPDPERWIVVLDDCAKACMSTADLEALFDIDSVKDARAKAPKRFQNKIMKILDTAVARLSPPSPDDDPANDGIPEDRWEAEKADAASEADTSPATTSAKKENPHLEFSAWLVDGEGDPIADQDGVIEQYIDPVQFALAYRDALVTMFPADIDLFRRANHDALVQAQIASSQVAAILASPAPEPIVPTEKAPWTAAFIDIPNPAKLTRQTMDDYNARLAEALQGADTEEAVQKVAEINQATYGAFPPKQRLAAKALVDDRFRAVLPTAPKGVTMTVQDIEKGLIQDLEDFDGWQDIDTWLGFAKVQTELHTIGDPGTRRVQAAAMLKKAELMKDAMLRDIQAFKSLAERTAYAAVPANIQAGEFLKAYAPAMLDSVIKASQAKKAELTAAGVAI